MQRHGAVNAMGRQMAAHTLRNLSVNIREPIANIALQPLIHFLNDSTSTPEGKLQAVCALQNLSCTPFLRKAIADAALPALASVLQQQGSAFSPGKLAAVRTLGQLANQRDLRSHITDVAGKALADTADHSIEAQTALAKLKPLKIFGFKF